MARTFDDGELERLKKNVSIEELCRSRGIDLKPHGRKDLAGKCPFHEDDTPSFIVTPDKNLFHCLGCDAGGSVIDLVMKLDHIEFKEAVQRLLTSGNLVKTAAETPPPKKYTVSPEKANTLLERVVTVYEKTFSEVPEGKAYLEKRGITDAGLFTSHRVGYANGKLRDLLPSDGSIRDDLKALGVLLDNGHERFAGCVVFPVYNQDGQLVTLYGRFTGDGKRHLYLPDHSTGLWNAVAVKTYPELILVESILDALSVMMAGHRNVLAIQGTNGLDDTDIRTLSTHGVQKITLLLDADEAGRNATARLKEKLTSSFSCRALALPDGDDPNSYLQQHGAQPLASFISEGQETATIRAMDAARPVPSESLSQEKSQSGAGALVFSYGMRRYEVRGLEKGPRKLRATIRVEHAGKLHVDTLDFYSSRSRRILAMDICRIQEEPPETIEADLNRLILECEKQPEDRADSITNTPAPTLSVKDREEAERLGRSPKLIQTILADFEACGLIGEASNKLLGYICMTSRKRDTPLSVLILSSSGAGKTALQDAVLSFCPPEDLVKLTSLSGKALFYKERLSLKHKVLALEEGDGAQEASYAIRNLISAKELVSESTIKDLATGRLVTMENKVEGPTAVFLTTTNPEVDPETKSRFFVTSIDESREQTRKILSFQRQRHLSDGLITSPEIEAVLKKHRNFQRLLKPLAVRNPYAEKLSYGDDRLQGRRDQPKYLNLIKAIAFLRQMQKEQQSGCGVESIEVDMEDIRLANELARDVLGHSLDELSRPARDLLLQLGEWSKKRTLEKKGEDVPSVPGFSRRDVREFTGWSNTRLHIHLKELVEFEYVIVETGRNGLSFRYRLAWDGRGQDGKRFVLGLKEG